MRLPGTPPDHTCGNQDRAWTLRHIPVKLDGTRTLEGVNAHSDHADPPNMRPAPTVVQSMMYTMIDGGLRSVRYEVRHGGKTNVYDVEKTARGKREYEREMHPEGDDISAVADFNDTHNDEFVLGGGSRRILNGHAVAAAGCASDRC